MNQSESTHINDELSFEELDLNDFVDSDKTHEIDIENTNNPERRRAVRAPKQEVKGRLRYQLKLDSIGKYIFETNIGRVIFSIILALSVWLLIWEFSFRLDFLENNITRNSENGELMSELELLQSQWSEDDLQKIERNIKKAESKIFNSVPSLAGWLNSKNSAASQLGFILKYNMGSAHKVDVDGTYAMPVSFDLHAKNKSKNIYIKALTFIRSIIDENRRLEIVSTEFVAEKQGVRHFSLTINLWVKDPNGIISIKKSNEASDDVELIQ